MMGNIAITFDWIGNPTDEQRAKALSEIADSMRHQLIEDFGPDAWGGYDGPRVENVEVEANVRGAARRDA